MAVRGLLAAALTCGSISVAIPAQAAPPAGVADARSAADASTASAIARQHGHAVTDLSSLTATTGVEALPDGTFQFTSSTEPVRVKRGNGWVAVSTHLVRGRAGMLTPEASPVPVEFSGGGSGPLARVQTGTGKWTTIASPLGALREPVVDGASVTYPDVLPDVDLRLSATVSGMSEVLVVKTAGAAANPRLAALRFEVSGAKVADGGASESATATADDGSQLVSASPMWWDSSAGGDAAGPGGAGLARPVASKSTASSITIDASVAADSGGVTYPAYIDPDFNGGTQAWTFVDSLYPTSSYWLGSNHGTDNQAHVGYISAAYAGDGAHTDRTYWQLKTSGLSGKHILSAKFNTQEIYSSACTTNPFNLYLTGGITSGTTWNTQPGVVQYVSQATLGPQGRSCSIPLQYGVGFDAMGVANYASAHGNAALTVMMRAVTETDFTTWRKFQSAASLTVTFNSYPNTPASPKYNTTACSTTAPGPVFRNSAVDTLKVSVTASDPDAGNLSTYFYVQTPAGANVLPSTYANARIGVGPLASGSTFSAAVPTSLADGSYRWTARAHDGTDWSKADSSICYFQIRNASPSAPVATPSTPTTDQLTVGQPITVTLAQGASGDNVKGFAYTWQPSVNAPTYSTLPACGTDSQVGGLHYVCGSSATIQVAPTEAPQAKLTIWAFGSASARSAATTLTWSSVTAKPASLYASAHQWTTDVGGTPAQCASGATTVSCIADNNPAGADPLAGQYPIAIPQGVTLTGSPVTSPVTFVAGAAAENDGGQTVELTVPAGVTTQHFGVVTVATANGGDPAGATLPGWTVRDDQFHPEGELGSSSYVFTRLGGQQAGDVLTVTLPAIEGATVAAAWYDTAGRDVQAVGSVWDTGANDLPFVTWPAADYTGTADVLLVAAAHDDLPATLGAPGGATTDYQQFTPTWNGGGIFGHADDVVPTEFTASWDGDAVAHDVNALQLVLAEPVTPVTDGPVGALDFGSESTTPMISAPGVVVDTTKSFTVGAWLTPTAKSTGYQTAVSARGSLNSGFFLQLDPQMRWNFVMKQTNGTAFARAVAASTAAIGQPVYVTGVWDAVNREVRLYINSTLSATQAWVPPVSPTADQGLTLGSAWYDGAVVDAWNGLIANPVVVQSPLTAAQIFQLRSGGFFPGLN